jgi:hypothetical protein
MSREGVDQDHQIVSKSRIFDVGVLALASDLPGSLQHSVHLIEVEIAEQRRDHSTLRNAPSARSPENDPQEMHDVRVLHPLGHLFQQPVVPDIVEVAAQIEVENSRLPLDDGFSHALYSFMRCPLGTVSKRPRLEIRLEDGL